jgi:uncharacterized integral membrane protein
VSDTLEPQFGDAMADRNTRNTVRIVVGVILVIVLVALIVDNTDEVHVGYVFGDVDMALWVLVLISAGLGAAIAYLVSWVRRH